MELSSLEVGRLRNLLKNDQALLIGDTTVVSTKVHMLEPLRPETVFIIKNRDAGKTFYGRHHSDEIIHMDVFHSLGELQPLVIARFVQGAIKRFSVVYENYYGADKDADMISRLQHFIDIQTGKGGGRVSGSLKYGQKFSVRKAHLNHCHLALAIPYEFIGLLFYVVDAVEDAILQCGLQLRKICSFEYEFNQAQGKDRSIIPQYADYIDTYLRLDNSLGNGEGQILDNAANKPKNKNSFINGMGNVDIRDTPPWEGSPKQETKREQVHYKSYSPTREVEIPVIYNESIAKYSQEVSYLLRSKNHLNTTKHHISTALPYRGKEDYSHKNFTKLCRSQQFTQNRSLGAALAVNKTISEALVRRVKSATSTLNIHSNDLHFHYSSQKLPLSLLLVLDASASMMGVRMQVASALSERLLRKSKDRIALIAIQEHKTRLVCEFTRNSQQIQRALAEVTPYGLTPLAAGLELAVNHIQQRNCNNPWVILLTDGIPTLSTQGHDPLAEAVSAAELIARANLPFCCIGLEPNKRILRRIVKAGQGSLYIVNELEESRLYDIVRRETSGA